MPVGDVVGLRGVVCVDPNWQGQQQQAKKPQQYWYVSKLCFETTGKQRVARTKTPQSKAQPKGRLRSLFTERNHPDASKDDAPRSV